jgi:hypothetical protein
MFDQFASEEKAQADAVRFFGNQRFEQRLAHMFRRARTAVPHVDSHTAGLAGLDAHRNLLVSPIGSRRGSLRGCGFDRVQQQIDQTWARPSALLRTSGLTSGGVQDSSTPRCRALG